MKKFTPLAKGIITGAVMLVTTLAIYLTKLPGDSPIQYLVYALYAGGIIWTLIDYSKTEAFRGKFGELFGQGFRCFIVVTLIMVAFVGIFSLMHPEMAEEAAGYYRADLVKQGNTTPADIDKLVARAKNGFTVSNMFMSIFGYLVTGTIFTMAGSAIVLMRRNQR